MERLTYVECGGYHNPRSLFTINRRICGEPHNRVCIQLCKPPRSAISIKDKQLATVEESDRISLHNHTDKDRFMVAGTSKTTIRYFTNKQTKVKVTNSDQDCCLAFNKNLKMCLVKEDIRNYCKHIYTSLYTFEIKDLSSLLVSEFKPSPPNTTQAVKKAKTVNMEKGVVNCVLQINKKNMASTKLLSNDNCLRIKGLNTLRCNCPFCKDYKNVDRELRLWKHMSNVLPKEMFVHIMKYMHYDQVSWLADKNETFARLLAYHKYGVLDSYDKNKYPNAQSVVGALRNKNAQEMRFHGNEDLWICSKRQRFPDGTCLRYRIKEGTYTWCKAALITALKLNSSRCMCVLCIELLDNLKAAMSESQSRTTVGLSRCKIFALKGSEDIPINTDISSVYWMEDSTPKDYTYYVHMWTDNLDNRWLQDLRTENNTPLTVKDYKRLDNFKTLMFKDPVKFFSVSKIVQLVDKDIAALLSSIDNEVLGYMVLENDYYFRVPVHDTQNVIGLNFVPECIGKENLLASELVRHIYNHDFEYTMSLLRNEATYIENKLQTFPPDVDGLKQRLEYINWKLAKLQIEKSQGCKLTRTNVQRENLNNNKLHVHETFFGDFEFCTRYLFEPLTLCSLTTNMKSTLDFITNTEMCTINSCNINTINQDNLEGFVAVSTKSLRSVVSHF